MTAAANYRWRDDISVKRTRFCEQVGVLHLF